MIAKSSIPTSHLFDNAPDFPSDVPLAIAPVIKLSDLETANSPKSKALLEACNEYGYILLDLTEGSKGLELLEAYETLCAIQTEMFDLGPETLIEFKADYPKSTQGYKPAGTLKTEDGNQDATQVYSIQQANITGHGAPMKHAPTIEAHRKDLQHFIQCARSVLNVILTNLERELDITQGTLSGRLLSIEDSAATLRLLRNSPPSANTGDTAVNQNRITLGGHTDFSAMTMLFNVLGGLQVLPAGMENKWENWRYVKPLPGHVIIQIGDVLVEWTGGVLRSNLHRVIDPPGKQVQATRQSIAYFVRPADDGSMKRLRGSRVIPEMSPEEKDITLTPPEWTKERMIRIMKGEIPESRGGLKLQRRGEVAA